MKIYVATNFSRRDEVKKIHDELRNLGYEISADWTTHIPIKPIKIFDKKITDLAKDYAVKDMKGVEDCDVFILITAKTGSGMYVELGAALLSNMMTGKPKIFVVGEHLEDNIFYFHPSVNLRKSVSQVIEELKL